MISKNAGKAPLESNLISVEVLTRAYFDQKPNSDVASERVSFGTSGHRGSSLTHSFNEDHILAITQAICEYRAKQNITGPLYMGFDTHALSQPAFLSALEVLEAHEVQTFVSAKGEFTPTPVLSRLILTYNHGRKEGLADGIIITPSHNPPDDGGFKYNPPHGGPAGKEITDVIQNRANELLAQKLAGVKRVLSPHERFVIEEDFVTPYVEALNDIIDFDVIRTSKIKLAVDPLGGAGVHYWDKIAKHYGIDLTVLNSSVDPTFRFMTCDWDGKIRMDPSSSYSMFPLFDKAKKFDLAFACDTDHDRHGIVTPEGGLMPSNHFLATSIAYLFTHRSQWKPGVSIGKTVVSSSMIDRVGKKLNREIYEVPVGFKWFVDGLLNGSLGFVGEESAGASFLKKDGSCWSTDKDGLIPCLLAAEMTARLKMSPAEYYRSLTDTLGTSFYQRVDAKANAAQRKRLGSLTEKDFMATSLAGEKIERILTHAPGNGAAMGGLKIETANAWVATRPSGTEDVYKIYAESFVSEAHLQELIRETQKVVDLILVNA